MRQMSFLVPIVQIDHIATANAICMLGDPMVRYQDLHARCYEEYKNAKAEEADRGSCDAMYGGILFGFSGCLISPHWPIFPIDTNTIGLVLPNLEKNSDLALTACYQPRTPHTAAHIRNFSSLASEVPLC